MMQFCSVGQQFYERYSKCSPVERLISLSIFLTMWILMWLA
jgi:hypothetical protein